MSKKAAMRFVLFGMTVVLIFSSVTSVAFASPAMAGCGLPGDLNEDGKVDITDIMLVANCWRSTDPECDPYDLDGDGDIDIRDIMLVAREWGNSCAIAPFAIDMSGLYTDADMRDLAVAAGFRLVRTWIHWSSIEPNEPVNGQHTYNWPDSMFDVFRNDRRLIPLVILSATNPSWAAAAYDSRRCGPIKDEHLVENGNFYDFVFNLVSRYADVTPYWVFYNEQDHWTDDTGGHDAGGCWGGHGDLYAQTLARAWDAAHSADPNAQVIFGSVAYEPTFDKTAHVWDEFFFRDAFQYMHDHPDDYVDIIAANTYNFRRDDWDGDASTLPQNQEVIAKFRQAVGDVNASFNVDQPYSIAKWQSEYELDKPMAAGEVGLHVGWWGTAEDPTQNDLQARHAVHVNVRGMAAGLKIITWYTLVDKPNEYKNGLCYESLDGPTCRPAYTAYQVLAQQLEGYEFDQQRDVGNDEIQAYRFDRDGVKKLVLWRDSGQKIKQQSSTATETMTVNAAELGTGWTGRVRVTDKLGSVSTYGSPGAPSVELTFSSDPIYVEAY